MEREEGKRRPIGEFGFVFVSLCQLKRGITEVYKSILICWDLAVLCDLRPCLPHVRQMLSNRFRVDLAGDLGGVFVYFVVF